MNTKRFIPLIALLLIVVVPTTQAQSSTCPSIVEAALESLQDACQDTGRNQVCYGNLSLDATPQDGVSSFQFERVGDIAPVNDMASLKLSPMDEESGVWGVAVMRLQASLPDTLPGQNVTFIMFGDVEVTNAVTAEQVAGGEFTPMQSFYFSTGIGDSRCSEAPESGVLVQTPEGVGEVSFVVNEMQVEVGSTVLFQAEPDDEMIVSVLEGSAALRYDGQVYPVVAGARRRVAINRYMRAVRAPENLETYDIERLRRLPLGQLQRQISVRSGFTPQQLRHAHERLQRGEPLCGQPPYPSCDRIPGSMGGIGCVLLRDGEVLIAPENRPICDTSNFNRENLPSRDGRPLDEERRDRNHSRPLASITPVFDRQNSLPRPIQPTALPHLPTEQQPSLPERPAEWGDQPPLQPTLAPSLPRR
jgi:hypothetical protein